MDQPDERRRHSTTTCTPSAAPRTDPPSSGRTSASRPAATPSSAGATIGRIEVRLRAKLTGSGSTTTNCPLLAALSWNNGASWTNATVATPALTTTETLYSLPAATSNWGTNHTWVQGDFTNANFRVRLTWNKVSCGSSRTGVGGHAAGRRGLREGPPGQRSSGRDRARAAELLGRHLHEGRGAPERRLLRPGDDRGERLGHLQLQGPEPDLQRRRLRLHRRLHRLDSDGQVRLFDPIYCATGPNTTSGWYGAGDHWTTQGSSGNTVIAPVAVTYRLYHDVNNTPYDTSDDDPPAQRLPTIRPARRWATSAARSGARAASRTSTTATSRTARPTRPTTSG